MGLIEMSGEHEESKGLLFSLLLGLHDGAANLSKTVATPGASPRVVGLRPRIIPRLAIIVGVLALDTVEARGVVLGSIQVGGGYVWKFNVCHC
jgi:hypothetical protein